MRRLSHGNTIGDQCWLKERGRNYLNPVDHLYTKMAQGLLQKSEGAIISGSQRWPCHITANEDVVTSEIFRKAIRKGGRRQKVIRGLPHRNTRKLVLELIHIRGCRERRLRGRPKLTRKNKLRA